LRRIHADRPSIGLGLRAMPYRFIMVIGLALLPTTMAGCANQEAFTAAIMPN
jgi:hypothetical protein